jgi:hypothetical protein
MASISAGADSSITGMSFVSLKLFGKRVRCCAFLSSKAGLGAELGGDMILTAKDLCKVVWFLLVIVHLVDRSV